MYASAREGDGGKFRSTVILRNVSFPGKLVVIEIV